MIRIPGIGGMLSPNYHFFPKYDAGRFEEGNSTMILSAGLSYLIKALSRKLVVIQMWGMKEV